MVTSSAERQLPTILLLQLNETEIRPTSPASSRVVAGGRSCLFMLIHAASHDCGTRHDAEFATFSLGTIPVPVAGRIFLLAVGVESTIRLRRIGTTKGGVASDCSTFTFLTTN